MNLFIRKLTNFCVHCTRVRPCHFLNIHLWLLLFDVVYDINKKTSREWEKAAAKSEREKEPVYVSVIKRFNCNWADYLYISRVATPSYCILCIHAVRTHFLPSTITQTNGPVILFTESTDRRNRRKIILTDTLWAWTWQSLSTSVASQ